MFPVFTSALCSLIAIFPNSPVSRNLTLLFPRFHRPLGSTGHFWPAVAWLVNLIKPLTVSHPKPFIYNSSCPLWTLYRVFHVSIMPSRSRDAFAASQFRNLLFVVLAWLLQLELYTLQRSECHPGLSRCGLQTLVLYHVGVISF